MERKELRMVHAPMYFLANKIDEGDERFVSTREGKQAATFNNDFFKEISVKEMTRGEISGIVKGIEINIYCVAKF